MPTRCDSNGDIDHYGDFSSLVAAEREWEDYGRVIVDRGSPIAIVAPHGGGIERGTSEIAVAIAGADYSLYCFEGRKERGNERLHICSTRFDDPRCLAIVRASLTVISVHGCKEKSGRCWVGGLDESLAEGLLAALRGRGFDAERDTTDHAGVDPRNLCNRGASGRGIQLEIARGLRRAMGVNGRQGPDESNPVFQGFTTAVRGALAAV